MAEDTEWFARAAGAALLVLGIGARFNNMYTPIFLEQCWLANAGALGLSAQAAFFLPGETTFLFLIQFGVSLLIFLINTYLCFDDILTMPSDMMRAAKFFTEGRLYMNARGQMGLDGYFCVFMNLYLISFGVALVSAPSSVFATGTSPVPYWSTDALSAPAVWFARFFGIGMLVMALGGSLLRVDRDVFLRQALLFNLIMGGLMYYGAYNLTSTVTFVWLCNLGVQGVVSLINLVAVCLDDVGVGIGML